MTGVFVAAAGAVTVTVTINVTGGRHEAMAPAAELARALETASAIPPALIICAKAGALVVGVTTVEEVMVVGTVAAAVRVAGVDAVWVAFEALWVHVSFCLEQSSTPNAAPARPEQRLNCDMQAALAAEGRSSKDSSSTMKSSPSEVTPGGRPPRERTNSKNVITSTMIVVVVTVVVTAVVAAAVVEAARVVAGVVVVSTASTPEALVEVDTARDVARVVVVSTASMAEALVEVDTTR